MTAFWLYSAACDAEQVSARRAALLEAARRQKLGVRENLAARLTFRQWRWLGRIAEILRPTPIPDFRQILEMLADVRVMLVELPVEHIDRIGGLRTEPRHMLERVNSQMEAAHLVHHHHVEGSGGGAHVVEAADVEAGFVGAAVD